MGYLNLTSSIRYDPHGKKRKTKAFTKKSKKQKYQELILEQQKVFDRVVREVSETKKIPSLLHKVVDMDRRTLSGKERNSRYHPNTRLHQEYNKGAYQVIIKSNIKDIGK